MPADPLCLTSDPGSGSGTGLIADLLARLIAQRKREKEREAVFLEIMLSLNFSVLGMDIWNNYMLAG